jgi:hypothetical protein
MNYAVEIGSSAMIYIPNFIKIDLGIQEFMGGRGEYAGRQQGGLIKLPFFFFKIREVW